MSDPRTQSVFFKALEQECSEKLAQFLEAECSGDPTLRSRVEELLLRSSGGG